MAVTEQNHNIAGIQDVLAPDLAAMRRTVPELRMIEVDESGIANRNEWAYEPTNRYIGLIYCI